MKNDIGFEHIHKHTHFSLLDGYAKIEEYVERSARIGQHYLCVTDHGMMAAVPAQIRSCEQMSNGEFLLPSGKKAPSHKISPIFGIEFYLQDKHVPEAERKHLSPDEMKEQRKSYHLIAIAHNLTGYTNLIKLSSWAWINGYYYRPRITYEQLMKHKEGVTFTSCCYLSEIGQAFDRGGPDAAEEKLQQYMVMFGEHFYLELMLLDFAKQKPYDAWLIKMHDKYHIPLEVTQDCHYSEPEDCKYQRYMLMIQKKSTMADIEKKMKEGEDGQDIFEMQDPNLWMKSEQELNDKWLSDYQDIIPLELFEQAKLNTVKICEKAKGIQIDREPKLPQIPDEKEKFAEQLMQGMKWRGINSSPRYQKRLMEEFDLITRKGYASYFLIQKMFTDEARRKCREVFGWGTGHEAVGPGRGSGVGSLCNYVLGITDVDPIKHGLLFSRFLNESRGGKSLKTRFTQQPIS